MALAVLLGDIFSVYVALFKAPLGMKNIKFEKWALTGTGIMDIAYDLALVAIHIFVGVAYNNDLLLIGTAIIGTFVLASDILQLIYIFFSYEQDHENATKHYKT